MRFTTYLLPIHRAIRRFGPGSLLAVAGAFVTPSIPLHAQVWTGAVDGDASVAGNWQDSVLPAATGAEVTFDGSSNTAVNNDWFEQLDRINFAAEAASFTITGDALGDFPAGGIAVDNLSLETQEIGLDFSLTGATNTAFGGRTNASTVLSGDISGDGILFINRSVSIGPNASTIVTLSGDNSAFSGIVRINSRARLNLASQNALGTALLWFNTSTSEIANTSGSAITVANDVELRGSFGFSGTDDFTTTGDLSTRAEIISVANAATTLTVGRLAESVTASPGDVVTKSGAGTFAISNAADSEFGLEFRAGAGTTQLGHANALGSGQLTIDQGRIASSTDLTAGNAVANNVTLVSSSATIGGAHNIELSGDIGDLAGEDTPEPGGLVVDSTAAVILSGTNTYTLATQVNGGTLLINGNNSAATGDVLVAAGSVLGGTGTIGGATTISGSLRPGNSIGTLTVANDVTWNVGEAWLFELGAGNTADLLDITDGAFLKGTGDSFVFDFDGSSETGAFTLIHWSSTDSLGGDVLGTSFELNDFDYENLAPGLSGTFAFDGDSLNITVIPEPGTYVLLSGLLGILVVVLRRLR